MSQMPDPSQFNPPALLPPARPAPPVAEELAKLPEALRQNVLAYAARKLRAVSKAIHQATAGSEVIYQDLMAQLGAMEEISTDIASGTITISGKKGAEMLRMLAIQPEPMVDGIQALHEIAMTDTGELLLRDKQLATLLYDLSKHYRGQLPPADLAKEAFGQVKHLMDTDKSAFVKLSRAEILPCIEEVAANVVKFTDYRKLAFAAVVGVACGVAVKDVLFPHKDPHQQPQLA